MIIGFELRSRLRAAAFGRLFVFGYFVAPTAVDLRFHGTSLKTRCTTLVPIPSDLPILRMPSPLALSSRMRASTDGLTRRRPNFTPFALARASPALTRLPNDSPLKLSEYPEHLKHRLARGRRSIESLLMKE